MQLESCQTSNSASLHLTVLAIYPVKIWAMRIISTSPENELILNKLYNNQFSYMHTNECCIIFKDQSIYRVNVWWKLILT